MAASAELQRADGRPPAAEHPQRQYIFTKISDCRKTCEWIAGLGIAYVLSAIIRAPELAPWIRHAVLPIGAAQVCIAIVGAWPVTDEVNSAEIDAALLTRFRHRRWARAASMFLLLVGLFLLTAAVW